MSPPPWYGGIAFRTLAPAAEDANARRAAKLVAGEDQKIAANLLHIKRHVPHALDGINERRHSELPGAHAQLFHWVQWCPRC